MHVLTEFDNYRIVRLVNFIHNLLKGSANGKDH
jgi:hypothetical protein